jgi:hypothetical protein
MNPLPVLGAIHWVEESTMINRILSFGLVAAGTVLLAQPTYARDNRGGGQAPAARSAPAPHFATHSIAPQAHFAQRSAPAPHFAVHSQPQYINKSASVAQARSRTEFSPAVTQARAFSQPRASTPSVAFGGHAYNNNGGNVRGGQPPVETSRSWDRGRVHTWDRHNYRWYNGGWVIIDDGLGYPDTYYNDNNVNDPPSAMFYDSSASVAASVQSQLDSQGYNAGPADGVIGPQSRDAITDFQYDHHLPVTGQIDGPLLRALGL